MDASRQPARNSDTLRGKHCGSSPDPKELNCSPVTSKMSFIKRRARESCKNVTNNVIQAIKRNTENHHPNQPNVQ